MLKYTLKHINNVIREWRMELSNWTILSLIDRDFAAQIRLACVFGMSQLLKHINKQIYTLYIMKNFHKLTILF